MTSPTQKVTYVIRGSSSPPQGSHPTKRARATFPHTNATTVCVRVMCRDYPVTGPSPGANPPIYDSSLPPASGNPLSNIFTKSHGFFFSRNSMSDVIHTYIHQCHGRRHTIPGWVVITDSPVYVCERGGGGRGGYGLRSAISTVSRYT